MTGKWLRSVRARQTPPRWDGWVCRSWRRHGRSSVDFHVLGNADQESVVRAKADEWMEPSANEKAP